MERDRVAFWTILAAAAGLAACASGGDAVTPSSPGAAAAKNATVEIRIRIPAKRVARTRAALHERFIASSTLGLIVDAYKANSAHTTANLISSTAISLAASSSACSGTGTERTCTAKVKLPPPAVDLELTTWSATPNNGEPAGKQLAAGSFIDMKIAAGKKNSLKLTLGGIPASVAMTLPSPTPVAGVQTSYIHGVESSESTIGLTVYDAAGDAILSDGFVDAAGAPESVAMSVTPSASTCGSATLQNAPSTGGTVIRIASPPASGVTFVFGATATAQTFTPSAPCKFSIAAGAAGLTTVYASFALLGPELTTYPINNAASDPVGITSGPDNNIWFADSGTNSIGTINVSTKTVNEYAVSASHPLGIVVGPDQNLWYTATSTIGAVTTTGTVAATFTPAPAAGHVLGQQIDVGPYDGLLWFTDPSGQDVDSISVNGKIVAAYPASPLPSPGPMGIVAGPKNTSFAGEIWYTENTASAIGAMHPDGTGLRLIAIPSPDPGSYPEYITFASDASGGNFWYTSQDSPSVNEINLLFGVTSFDLSASARPWGIGVGPDGAVWFTDLTGYIDRVPTNATSASQVTTYFVGTGSQPLWVTTGSDGALWFTAANAGTGHSGSGGFIGRLTY